MVFSTSAQSALALSLRPVTSALSAHEEWLAEGILFGVKTARVAGIAVKALCELSEVELKALVADVIANCELQCDVPRYLNARFCPIVEPLVIPESLPVAPSAVSAVDAFDAWFAACIA